MGTACQGHRKLDPQDQIKATMINDERCERYHDTQDVIMAQWKSFSGAMIASEFTYCKFPRYVASMNSFPDTCDPMIEPISLRPRLPIVQPDLHVSSPAEQCFRAPSYRSWNRDLQISFNPPSSHLPQPLRPYPHSTPQLHPRTPSSNDRKFPISP